MLIIVPHAEVKVKKRLIRVILKLRWQGLHLLMREADLRARFFLLQEITERADPLVGLIFLAQLTDTVPDSRLLVRVEEGGTLRILTLTL